MRFFKKRSKIKKRSGYSFIEVMVAVFLVTTGLLAAVYLVSKSLAQSLDSRDQQVADLLAQEGVELVRNVRDNNWLANAPSSFLYLPPYFPAVADGLVHNCIIGPAYAYSYSGNPLAPGGTNILCGAYTFTQYHLCMDGNGVYSYCGAPPYSNFYRRISIVRSGSGNSETATVYSIVVWGGSSMPDVDLPSGTVPSCTTANKCVYTSVKLSGWGG